MAAMTDAQIRAVRAEVGTSPSDDDLQDLWDTLNASVPAVALAVLRPRLADALTSRSVTIPGSIGIGAAPSPKYLSEQIVRLETLLAAETGEPDASGLAGAPTRLVRHDRVR